MNKLIKISSLVADYHTNFATKDSRKVRGHDKETPYYTHPIGCAFMVMEDNNNSVLTYKKRFELAVSLYTSLRKPNGL